MLTDALRALTLVAATVAVLLALIVVGFYAAAYVRHVRARRHGGSTPWYGLLPLHVTLIGSSYLALLAAAVAHVATRPDLPTTLAGLYAAASVVGVWALWTIFGVSRARHRTQPDIPVSDQPTVRQHVARWLTRGPVTESEVMGKAAIATSIVWWQLPVFGYIVGVTGSQTVTEVGGGPITALWMACFVLAGALMVAAYRLRAPTTRAWAEIAVLLLFITAMAVYLAAFLDRADTLDGRLAIVALLGSMISCLTGRLWLLGRQIHRVTQVKRQAQPQPQDQP